MPRRSPGEIRKQLPRRINRGSRASIRGLSPSASRQIAAFERQRGLHPGDVAHAFRAWSQALRRLGPHDELSHGCGTTGWRDMHARTMLEAVLHSMKRRARRELRVAVSPLDARYLAKTLNDPFAPPDLPWWKCRIRT
ncbi:hypothetical protein [Streptomyces roseus]|uniref:hypothetical protein n=1 Tax=Streptomyces roseus TaxID=66430 RepID=UPI00131AA644|nr:hypothetical protein [Streptomyces roseus]